MIELDYVAYGLTLWNLIVFIVYGMDKHKAKKNKWRISENTLIVCAFLMGGLGALLGIGVFAKGISPPSI